MTVEVLCVGKITKAYLAQGIADYSKRILSHAKLKITEIPEQTETKQKAATPKGKVKEQQLLTKYLLRSRSKHSYSIALSPKAPVMPSSTEFAHFLEQKKVQGYSHFCFVIGGSEGLAPEVFTSCDQLLSFSPMTFPHQLFRLILLEQIYRSLKISAGQTYHK